MENFTAIVPDEKVKKLIGKLIDRSAAFSYEPQADGHAQFTVKAEHEQWLTKTIGKLK